MSMFAARIEKSRKKGARIEEIEAIQARISGLQAQLDATKKCVTRYQSDCAFYRL